MSGRRATSAAGEMTPALAAAPSAAAVSVATQFAPVPPSSSRKLRAGSSSSAVVSTSEAWASTMIARSRGALFLKRTGSGAGTGTATRPLTMQAQNARTNSSPGG